VAGLPRAAHRAQERFCDLGLGEEVLPRTLRMLSQKSSRGKAVPALSLVDMRPPRKGFISLVHWLRLVMMATSQAPHSLRPSMSMKKILSSSFSRSSAHSRKELQSSALGAALQRREAQVKHSFLGQLILNRFRHLSRVKLRYTTALQPLLLLQQCLGTRFLLLLRATTNLISKA